MNLLNKLRFKNTGVTQSILKVRHPSDLSRISLETDKCSGYGNLEIIITKGNNGYSGVLQRLYDGSKIGSLQKIELKESNRVVTVKCIWVDAEKWNSVTECNMSFQLNARV